MGLLPERVGMFSDMHEEAEDQTYRTGLDRAQKIIGNVSSVDKVIETARRVVEFTDPKDGDAYWLELLRTHLEEFFQSKISRPGERR